MTDGGRQSVYATTAPVRPEVAGAMLPSSLYALAREAAKRPVEETREKGG